MVLKKESDSWWELGSFVCCGPCSGLVDPLSNCDRPYGTERTTLFFMRAESKAPVSESGDS